MFLSFVLATRCKLRQLMRYNITFVSTFCSFLVLVHAYEC